MKSCPGRLSISRSPSKISRVSCRLREVVAERFYFSFVVTSAIDLRAHVQLFFFPFFLFLFPSFFLPSYLSFFLLPFYFFFLPFLFVETLHLLTSTQPRFSPPSRLRFASVPHSDAGPICKEQSQSPRSKSSDLLHTAGQLVPYPRILSRSSQRQSRYPLQLQQWQRRAIGYRSPNKRRTEASRDRKAAGISTYIRCVWLDCI